MGHSFWVHWPWWRKIAYTKINPLIKSSYRTNKKNVDQELHWLDPLIKGILLPRSRFLPRISWINSWVQRWWHLSICISRKCFLCLWRHGNFKTLSILVRLWPDTISNQELHRCMCKCPILVQMAIKYFYFWWLVGFSQKGTYPALHYIWG